MGWLSTNWVFHYNSINALAYKLTQLNGLSQRTRQVYSQMHLAATQCRKQTHTDNRPLFTRLEY